MKDLSGFADTVTMTAPENPNKMTIPHPECYEFRSFRFIVESADLTRNGTPVSIAPKTGEVLTVLLRDAGRLVSKETFMKEVWLDTFVEEGNLTNAISKLRAIFGGKKSEYIRTETRKGYCFEATVTQCGNIDHTATDPYFSKHGFFEDYPPRFSELFAQTTTLTVFFIHSRRWRENHRADLTAFLREPNTHLTVFLPNLENKVLFASLRKGFLDGTKIRHLVSDAYEDFAAYSIDFPGKVTIHTFDHYPTYSFYRFDDLFIVAMYPTVVAKRQVPTFEIPCTSEYRPFFEGDLEDLLKGRKLTIKEVKELRGG